MKRTLIIFFLTIGTSLLTFAQKTTEIDTVRAPLASVYNVNRLLITLQQDSVKFKVQLEGNPKTEIAALGALDVRPGDTLTLRGVKNPRKKIREKDPLLISASILSVDYAPDHEDQPCYLFSMDQKPAFMGRDYNYFSQWVNSKLVYPEDSRMVGSEGTVRLRFIIDLNGEVTDLEVVDSSGDPALDAEAFRVVFSSPKWQPGLLNGKPVKARLTFPVKFALQNRKTTSGRR